MLFQNCSSSKIDTQNTEPLRITQFKDLDSLLIEEPKPIAIFIHTDWCKYCKNMAQTTFKNQAVINTLNENFYFISFNGESKDDIEFNNQTYKYQPSGRSSGIHKLAIEIGMVDGEVSYPTFVVLDPNYEILFQYNAFLSGLEMLDVLNRFL
ncbi:MAG: thioredoxin family protein [Saprospiraceae bacterium]|nr:thioredoxin family protein [Saprospiraceae bacterium]